MERIGIEPLVDHQVGGFRALVLDVRARGVEVDVARHHLPGLQDRGEQQVLGDAPLVRGDDVAVAEDVADGRLEVIVVPAPGVGLVAQHEPGPLVVAHRRRAAVGEQVHVDRVRGHREDVEPRIADGVLALFAAHAPERLDDLDAKRLGGEAHGGAV